MTIWLAGLALGAAGSLHCILMCGPLAALASPRGAAPGYHLGRALTYVVLGCAAGWAGMSASYVGAGRLLAYATGGWLIVMAFLQGRRGVRALGPAGARLVHAVGVSARWIRDRRGGAPPVVFGVLNGLLPCGLLYAAIVASAGLGSARLGALFMAGFAFGTVPLLVVAGLAGRALAGRMPKAARILVPVAIGLLGVLLIARGSVDPRAHEQDVTARLAGHAH